MMRAWMLFAMLIVSACSRAVPPGTIHRCPQAAYEILAAAPAGTLHAITDARVGVRDAAACAALCSASPGCTCAWYARDRSCAWRVDSCASSELYVDGRAIAGPFGLLRMCPRAPLWSQCGGSGYEGPTTCVRGARCVAQNAYYSQCESAA
jgi:hypothetical protein